MRKLPALPLLALLLTPALAADAADPGPGFSVKHMDLSIAPGADFAKFAAGGWYGRTTIPSDKSRWGGFDELAERNWGHVRGLVEAAAANPGARSEERRVGKECS